MSALEHPWPAPPDPGTTTEVAPGVRWVRMPLPFQLDHVNLWLLDDGPAWTVIDTGIGLEPTRALWERLFATALDGRPVGRIVVTHFHPDHIGNAGWLAARWSTPVACSQAEWLTAHLAWRGEGGNHLDRRIEHYRRHGVAPALLEEFRGFGNHYRPYVPSLADEYRALHGGDTLEVGGRTWHAITVRGHAPEHLCFHCPELGLLISGDQVLPRISTNVSVWPDQPLADPLRLYLASLARLAELPPDTLVLPSHGLPFRGLASRTRALEEHHAARLDELRTALDAPRTAAELVPRLFRRALDAHQLGFAIGETLAHAHRLEQEGAVARETADGVVRFFRAG